MKCQRLETQTTSDVSYSYCFYCIHFINLESYSFDNYKDLEGKVRYQPSKNEIETSSVVRTTFFD